MSPPGPYEKKTAIGSDLRERAKKRNACAERFRQGWGNNKKNVGGRPAIRKNEHTRKTRQTNDTPHAMKQKEGRLSRSIKPPKREALSKQSQVSDGGDEGEANEGNGGSGGKGGCPGPEGKEGGMGSRSSLKLEKVVVDQGHLGEP